MQAKGAGSGLGSMDTSGSTAESKTSLAYEVPLGNIACQSTDESLQGAFAAYRKKKKDELQLKAKEAKLKHDEQKNPALLRATFLEKALSYLGTPYARRYHEPNSPTFSAKLFLDCCGLVRKVLKDLMEEFGFSIGPWNQAYMFDTLPLAYSEPSQMEPGDLVFVSGIYNNANAKKQHHNIVHVEIWLGQGEKVIGARWQKGSVEVHDSYKFAAKSYHSMEYHFRSISTWLAGECKSYCSEHAWQVHKFDPSKHSIFALGEEEEPAYDQLEVIPPSSSAISAEQSSEHQQVVNRTPNVKLGRAFVICGGNAGPLVEEHLISNGWWKTDHYQMYTLKWTELRHSIDYKCFREGEQLVNHFPNINILTTKIGLLDSLRTYYRLQRPRVPLDIFFPKTFRMDLRRECEEFVSICRKDEKKELWICKPTSANQGKGIYLVRDVQQALASIEQGKKSCKPATKSVARIIQRYISNPLLLRGRKFDLRVYMLLVWGKQWIVFFREGYVRLCCGCYDVASDNLAVHLTNQYQQKKSPLYSEVKEDTIWDFRKLQGHVSAEYGLPSDWVETTLTERMISIMTICFKSVKNKLSQSVGFFELLGFDFMLDSNLNVWLIEVNMNPALHRNCETLMRISPSVVHETLDIAIEVFDKCRKNRTLDPLTSVQHFRRLYRN